MLNEIIDKYFKDDYKHVISVIANLDMYKVKSVRGNHWKESFATLNNELVSALTNVLAVFEEWKKQKGIFVKESASSNKYKYLDDKDKYPQVAAFIFKHFSESLLISISISDVVKEIKGWFEVVEKDVTKPNDKSFGDNYTVFYTKGSKTTQWDGKIPSTIFFKDTFITTWWPGDYYGKTISYWATDPKETWPPIRDFSRSGKK